MIISFLIEDCLNLMTSTPQINEKLKLYSFTRNVKAKLCREMESKAKTLGEGGCIF